MVVLRLDNLSRGLTAGRVSSRSFSMKRRLRQLILRMTCKYRLTVPLLASFSEYQWRCRARPGGSVLFFPPSHSRCSGKLLAYQLSSLLGFGLCARFSKDQKREWRAWLKTLVTFGLYRTREKATLIAVYFDESKSC